MTNYRPKTSAHMYATNRTRWWNERAALTKPDVQEAVAQGYMAGFWLGYEYEDRPVSRPPARRKPQAFKAGMAAIEAWLESPEGRARLAKEEAERALRARREELRKRRTNKRQSAA